MSATMADPGVLDVWEFERDDDPVEAAGIAGNHMVPPDFRALLLADQGEVITVQVVQGALRSPDSVLYVERRGPHDVLRRAEWLPAPGESRGRSLLTLRARGPRPG